MPIVPNLPSGVAPLVDYICCGPTCAIKVSIPDHVVPFKSVFYCDHCSQGYTWGIKALPCPHVYFGVRLDANGDADEVYCRDCKFILWVAGTVPNPWLSLPPIVGTTPVPGPVAYTLPLGLWGGLLTPEKKEVKPDDKPGAVLCTCCQRELSPYLDAFYGDKNDPQGKKCDPCRRRK